MHGIRWPPIASRGYRDRIVEEGSTLLRGVVDDANGGDIHKYKAKILEVQG